MYPKTLILLHASRSHVNAARNLILHLIEYSENVALAVSKKGLEFCQDFPCTKFTIDSMPFATGFEEILSHDGWSGYIQALLLRKSMALRNSRASVLISVLQQYRPSIIIVDVLYVSDTILVQRWCQLRNIQIIIMRTKPQLYFDYGLTPACSQKYFENIRMKKIQWNLLACRKVIKRLIDFIRYQGYDDYSMIQRTIAEYGFKNNIFPLLWYRSIGLSLPTLPELVLLPREFELGFGSKRANVHYCGFQYTVAPPITGLDNVDVINKVKNLASHANKKIIVASFGSMSGRFQKRIHKIIGKLVRAIEMLEVNHFHLFVLSPHVPKCPEWLNHEWFRSVSSAPLFNLLEFSDLLISHGGINSIKDALATKKPMLIFPLNSKWDQKGNALKILRLGLGLTARHTDSTKSIQTKLIRLISDPKYSEAHREFKSTIKKYDKAKLEHILKKVTELEVSGNLVEYTR